MSAAPRSTLAHRLRLPLEDDASPDPDRCANCGTLLGGPYCVRCGQAARSLREPLTLVLAHWAEDLFWMDSRVLRTLGALAVPGALTADYLAGRRVRYVPPHRLYLFVSFVFFLVSALTAGEVANQAVPPDQVHAALGQVPEHLSWLGRALERIAADPAGFAARLRSHLPTALFFLAPVVATGLKPLYRARFWTEHLVFALHVQTVAFFALGVSALPMPAALAPAFGWSLAAGMGAYVFLALRRVYGGRPFGTAVRLGALTILAGMALLVIQLAVLVVAALA